MRRILFVCHGNICRSPMAEFILMALVKAKGMEDLYYIESAAVSDEEYGNPIYPPARRCLKQHGVQFDSSKTAKSDLGCLSIGFNVLWILCGWWEIAIVHVVFGLIFCVTIIGIPLGIQHFKIAGYSLMPFGRTIN